MQDHQPIAIIGMACRFPGAPDHHMFWKNLDQGRHSIGEIPPTRWSSELYFSSDFEAKNKTHSKWCGLMDGIERFDRCFFNLSPGEARQMDPQQRLLLEETWHCVEDSGLPVAQLRNQRTGVYVGVMARDYHQVSVAPRVVPDRFSALGNYDCILANRISHLLGLVGPSMAVDAACASSLVTIHQAKQALRSGECDYAFAAGVSLNLHPWKYVSFSKARMLSPQGLCKTFDKDADGYVPGDGVGVLLLQPLEAALAAGNRIHGVLRGSAVNHGGDTRSITAPRVASQQDVISSALHDAGVGADTLTYVEAHGTGTSLGDPIEVEALTRAFRQFTPETGFCKIGSVKSNIGHLEAAAGVAGVIKVLLMMRHRRIPKTLHVKTLNPVISFEHSPFEVALEPSQWHSVPGKVLRAGVSSFGFGGVNSHVVLEEPPDPRPKTEIESVCELPLVLTLSARSRSCLDHMLRQWKPFLAKENHQLRDVAATAATTRASFEFRTGVLVASGQTSKSIRNALKLPENKVQSRSWALRVGGFGNSHSGLPHWFSEEITLVEASHGLFKTLDKKRFGSVDQFLKPSWPSPLCQVYGFLFEWLFIAALIDCGFSVEEIEVSPGGIYHGLVLAGMVSPQEVATAILNGSPEHLTPLKRPKLTFHDPLRHQIIQPFCVRKDYVQKLRKEVLQHSLSGNSLVQKTTQLYGNQQTFTRFVNSWETILAAAGRSFQSLLLQAQSGTSTPCDAGLFLVIVEDALRRLNQKWDLSEKRQGDRRGLDELLDLLSDGVLTQRLVTGLILDSQGNRDDTARSLAARLSRIDHRKPYLILRDYNRHLEEIDDVPRWIGQMLQNDRMETPKGLALFPVGGSQRVSAEKDTIEVPELNARAFRATLLNGWLRGASVNWDRLFPQGSFKKVTLPNYPFEGESLWLQETETQPIPRPQSNAEQITPNPGIPWFYRPNWVGINAATRPLENRRKRTCVLLSTVGNPVDSDPFKNIYGQVRTVSLELPRTVTPVQWETNIENGVGGIVNDLPPDFEAVDLYWLAGLSPPESGNPAEQAEWLLKGLLPLAKWLMAAKPGIPFHLVVVTSQSFAVAKGDVVRDFASGTLAGLLNAVVLERRRLTAALVDLPSPSSLELLPRCPWRAGGSQVLAYRGGHWYRRSFVAWQSPATQTSFKLTNSDVVLITGGLGGLGRLLAKHLTQMSDCHLILVGRRSMDSEKSQFLNKLGQKVEYYPVDLTDAVQLNNLLNEVRGRLGPLTAVIHAGGVLQDGLLADKAWSSVVKVLEPKVRGTWNLHRATVSDPLKVFALFSSVVSVLGNQGQADYAAANAFLDSFADYRAQGKFPGVSLAINWTLWQEGGMGLDSSVIAHFQRKSGVITAREGLDAFQKLIGGPPGQVVVAGRDDLFQEPEAQRIQHQVAEKEEKILDLQNVTHRLLPILAEIAEVPLSQVDSRGDLRDLGLDSIALGQFADRIESCFKVPATAVLLFEMSQIEKLARWIAEEIKTLGGELPSPPEVQSKNRGWVGTPDSSSLSPGNVQDGETNSEQKQAWKPAAHPNTFDSQMKEGGDIAVIGLSGRYPQASNWRAFWQQLAAGRDCITEVPEKRWNWRPYFHPQQGKPGRMYSKWGGFLDGVDHFDARFFNISPAEAETMDPQERLFTEAVWTAMEDGGYTPASLARNFPLDEGSHVGVFAGVTTNTYLMLGIGENGAAQAALPTSMPWSVANRVSWLFDFRGPSLPVDTACSASLVAVRQACESLRKGECSVAFAGGVNLYLHPAKYLYLCEKRMLSPTGKCHSFGAQADGFVPGEGVGVVMLKPLEQAIRDRDVIHGIIKGGAVNHGGRTHGYTVPNPNAQARLIEDALKDAKVDGESISYVEAHGTGTALGDPIEIRSLKKNFNRESGTCALGSVKTNIGHLESAAGIAGLTKILLQMKHKRLVPSLNSREANPKIDLLNSPFRIPQESESWDGTIREQDSVQIQNPLRAGISSFGAGGVNAHLIVEEFPQEDPPPCRATPEIVLLSARNEERLRVYALSMVDFLESTDGQAVTLTDLGYTTRVGREPQQERMAMVVSRKTDLISQLKTFVNSGETGSGCWRGSIKSGSPVSDTLHFLLQGASGDQFLQTALDHGEWEKLAQLWVRGAVIDWQNAQHHFAGPEPRRVSLPTYPFEPTSHWVATVNKDETPPERPQQVEEPSLPPSDSVICRAEWLASPIPGDGKPFSGVLVVFDYDDDFSEHLKTKIPSGQTWLVKPGREWVDHGEGIFSLCPLQPGNFKKLIARLRQLGTMPVRILHLWTASSRWEFFGDAMGLGFRSVFHLCRTLVSSLPKSKVDVLFAHDRGKAEPKFSALGGFARSLAREPQGLGLRIVGVDTAPDKIASQLWREFQSSDLEVTLTKGQRLVRHLAPLTLPEVKETNHPAIRQGAVILITGGLGGLGFIFAKWLIREFQVKLVLCGRSELDRSLKQRLLQLQTMGSQVVYVCADLTLRDDVAKVVSVARGRFGALHGIIHAAGIIRDATLPNKTWETVAEVMAPKLQGTVFLDGETASDDLDFFVCFSSIAAVAGSAGQGDYAFANRFMDEFIAMRAKSNRPGRSLSMAWPLWADGGMGVTESVARLMKQTTGVEPLSDVQGLSLFSRALVSGEPFVVAAAGDVKKIRSYLRVGMKHEVGVEQPELRTAAWDEKQSPDGIGDLLVAFVSRILKIPEHDIDLDEDLGDFGFDSVSFTNLASAVNEAFGTDLVPAVFYEYANLRSFEAFLIEKCQRNKPVAKGQPVTAGEPMVEPAKAAKTSLSTSQPISKAAPNRDQAIAIIGMAGRMPGSEDLDQFWHHLRSMTDLISEVPADRWRWRDYFGHSNKEPNKTRVKWGGFMPDAACFDASFFGMAPAEALAMDPQQRLFLETVWQLIETAGYDPTSLSGSKTGLFAGAASSEYAVPLGAGAVAAHQTTGMCHALIANRISWILNLRGPSETLDTACSSSLVAIHHAMAAIRSGECESAIAGGVHLLTDPRTLIAFDKGGMLSPRGRCRSFDAGADGYVRGEGVGAVWLKPLENAERDGDEILGVIRGIAINHGGRTSSLTAPNPKAQAEVVERAHQQAGFDPETLGYLEAQAAGTPLGDSAELNGLKAAFGNLYQSWEKAIPGKPHCGLGTVKTNIGNLDAAAGIAGLIKVLLAMKHKTLPGTVHFQKPSPQLQLEDSPFYVVDRTRPWKALRDGSGNPAPRRAGVSAFGFGGVNAHLVLEEYRDTRTPEPVPRETRLILLSARTQDQLKTMARQLRKKLLCELDSGGGDALFLARLARTLRTGRPALKQRLALICDSAELLADHLKAFLQGDTSCVFSGCVQRSRQHSEKKSSSQESLRTDDLPSMAKKWVAGGEFPSGLPEDRLSLTRLNLPPYPFERRRFWSGAVAEGKKPDHRLKPAKPPAGGPEKTKSNQSASRETQIPRVLTRESYYVADHQLNGRVVLPAAAHLEMVREALAKKSGRPVGKLVDVTWTKPLHVEESALESTVTLTQGRDPAAPWTFSVGSGTNGAVEHSRGSALLRNGRISPVFIDGPAIQKRCPRRVSKPSLYQHFHGAGLDYGACYQTVNWVAISQTEALAELALPQELESGAAAYEFHPCLLDGAFQVASFLANWSGISKRRPWLPFSLGEMELFQGLNAVCQVYVKRSPAAKETANRVGVFQIILADSFGRVLAKLNDFSIRRIKIDVTEDFSRQTVAGGV